MLRPKEQEPATPQAFATWRPIGGGTRGTASCLGWLGTFRARNLLSSFASSRLCYHCLQPWLFSSIVVQPRLLFVLLSLPCPLCPALSALPSFCPCPFLSLPSFCLDSFCRVPQSTRTNSMYFAVLPFCVLCRSALPKTDFYFDRPARGGDAGDWEFDVLCFFNMADDVQRDPLQVHVLATDLADDSFLYCGRDLTLRSADGSVRHSIERAVGPPSTNSVHDLSRPLFFAHRDCWKVARRRHRGLPASQLYRFAQATQPILQHPDLGSGCESRPPVALLSQTDLETQPDDNIFSQCHRLLPPELLGEVVRHLVGGSRNNLAMSLAMATQTSSALLGLVPPNPTPSVTAVNLLPQGTAVIPRNGRIRAPTIELFGRDYLSRLEFVPDADHVAHRPDDRAVLSVRVQPHLISGARFILGMHGLRAVCFILQDGSTTAWLGEPDGDGCCHGHVAGPDLGRFQVLQDDLKVVRVDYLPHMDAYSRQDPSPPSKALWDVDPDSSQFKLATTKRIADCSWFPVQVLHYPGWRPCCYLPLIGSLGGGGDATGLTVHCFQTGGTSAITVHYETGASRTSGDKTRGLPLYFNLGPSERVDFVAVGAPECIEDPCLMVGTNRGRSAFFGPCYNRYNGLLKWTVAASEPVAGLIVDPLAGVGSSVLKNVGAATAATSQPACHRRGPPALPAFWGRANDRRPFTDIYSLFTSARVFSPNGVRRLRARTIGERYTGLCLHHADGTIESLGQWDGSVEDGDEHGKDGALGVNAGDTAVVVTDIFNGTEAQAPRAIRWIAFHYADSPYSSTRQKISHVVDIRVGFGEHDMPSAGSATGDDGKHVFRASDLGTELLAWWCKDISDYVEPWDGEMAVHAMPDRDRPPVVLRDS
ncbi:hypothetical protein MAPG_10566 [Magnaporthiopsis poae ATCC 64411]|uniref:Uncharacterized protein n=1 Tax=Magnaporthiopsis poae (strain ATCC 64411 / 73-15) TaxID=644358 RepID=A0A0C4ECX7_MAGP6|nr:hypothetical protein MAPG_10566 [Magnaporthiopsis poae ATCC 64411]